MVEWKKIGDIAKCYAGATPSTKNASYWEDGIIPWMSSGEVHQGIVTHTATYITQLGYDNSSTKMIPKGSIVIALAGQGKTRGSVAITDIELCTNQSLCGIVLDKSDIINKYVYYFLGTRYNHLRKISSGEGTRGGLNLKMISEYEIPIPAISEQVRIVGILDTFTSSIDNLKQQIAQRRKQYEYYRDQLFYASKADLLEASKRGEAIVKSLDDLGTFTRGRRFVRTDIVPEGVPCIHYGDMYTYYGISAEETPTHLTKELSSKLRFAKNGDVVIVAAGENDLDIGVGVAWLGKEPVVVHDACFIFEHEQNPKYLSHFMRSRNYHQQIRMGVVDGKICSISAKELGRALIAVPSLQEQQRIVSILDTFEASIQNLEAQLAQREKQYEYYRNKLLTFED